VSWVARKQINEWQEKGHDNEKIQALGADIIKKAKKTTKSLLKICNEEVFK